jgi:hypothetical protein
LKFYPQMKPPKWSLMYKIKTTLKSIQSKQKNKEPTHHLST